MRLALVVVGVPEACAGIEGGVTRMQIAAARQMGVAMLELRNYTVSAHLHGPTGANTVQQRSGNLARSLTSQVTEEGAAITGLVGFPEAATAPYARILDLGGTTRAHVIEAKKGQALAFHGVFGPIGKNGEGMTFRRKVNHPGSKFPARPFLESSLAEQAAQIKESLAAAMLGSIA